MTVWKVKLISRDVSWDDIEKLPATLTGKKARTSRAVPESGSPPRSLSGTARAARTPLVSRKDRSVRAAH
jgi:hypothetical protein